MPASILPVETDKATLSYEIKTITPSQANELLSNRNVRNRFISHARVNKYSIDMAGGAWRNNGDPIRFDGVGNLVDGQHRLSAVVQSGLQQTFVVVSGLTQDDVYTIDTGKPRTGSDVLAIEIGVKPSLAQSYAAALKVYGLYKEKKRFGSGGTLYQTNASTAALYYENEKLLVDCADWVISTIEGQILLMPKSKLIGLAMIFSELNEDDCKEFLKPVLTGAGLADGSTQKNLRDILIKVKSGVSKHNSTVLMHTFIKCWNSYRGGRNISVLHNVVWRSGSSLLIAE